MSVYHTFVSIFIMIIIVIPMVTTLLWFIVSVDLLVCLFISVLLLAIFFPDSCEDLLLIMIPMW